MMPLHVLETSPERENVILFLHGGGLNARQWQTQMAELTDFHGVAPDLPEHGGSASIGPLSLDLCASGVLDAVDRYANGKRVYIVGHSFGASVALEALRRRPAFFSGALLSGGSAGLSPALVRISNWSATLTGFISPQRLVEMSFNQFRIPAEQRSLFERDLLRSVQPAFMRRLTAAMQDISLPVKSEVPALALVGEHETIPARQAARKIALALRNARSFEVPQVHHVWNLEKPELFSRVVRDWVTEFQVRPPLRPLN